jgi:NAD+ synthase (glutamine-hydrolysing)
VLASTAALVSELQENLSGMKVVKAFVKEDKSAKELMEEGLLREEICRVIKMVDKNEYKRRQSPPGVKITHKAFGKDRRLPITNHYSSCNGEK